MRALLAIAAFALVSCAGADRDAFIPSARQPFEGFVALNPPRADLAVGAIWADDRGPIGAGADPRNIETVRTFSSLVVDRKLQGELSLGLFGALGIDPKARDQFSARFGDLTVVRVKDTAKLPRGGPRIVEALRAATLTVTSDAELGLGGETASSDSRFKTSGTLGRSRTYSIEGRDLFIAVKVRN